MSKICACHQPNYLPWLGYFDKMKKSDIFVLFDDVQVPTDKEFVVRNSIKGPNGIIELIVPIKNKKDKILIKDAFVTGNNWQKKHFKSIVGSYQKAPYFKKYIRELERFYKINWKRLSDLNSALICILKDFLGIKTKLVFSSDLGLENLQGEEKILGIIKKLGGDTYISGTGVGSKRYIIPEDFEREGIKLIWQEFQYPVYPQLWGGEFVPKLSVIDYLFNCGKEYE